MGINKRAMQLTLLVALMTSNISAPLVNASEAEKGISEKTSELEHEDKVSVHTDSPLTAKEITLGENYQFLTESSAPYWVKFTVPEQGYITINCEKPVDSSGAVGDMIFELLDSNLDQVKHILTYAFEETPDPNYVYTIGLKPGEYYLDLGTSYNMLDESFDLEYMINFVPTQNYEIESNNSKETATDILLNTPKSGVLENSTDEDFYKVIVDKDTKVRFKLNRDFNNTLPSEVYRYVFSFGDGSSKYISEDNMDVAEDGSLYQYVILKKGTNYLSAKTTADLIEYTITLEEVSNHLPVITATDKVFSDNQTIYHSDLLKGVTAYDKEDGDLTVKVKIVENTVESHKPGVYKVVYEVTDSDGNKVTETKTVTITSNAKPVLHGVTDITIKQNSTFDALKGVTATDTEDGDLTSEIKVSGFLDTKVPAVYQLEYAVTDSDGNRVAIPRTITVIKQIKFSDVHSYDWYHSYIYKFVEKGYLQGYSDGTFRPNNPITRAEFVKVVNRTFGLTDKGNMPFGDVYEGWQKDEVAIGVQAGYLSTENKNFRPNDPITREEASKIVGVVGDYVGDGKMTFEDRFEIADYAKLYVDGLVEAGILDNGKKFRPKDNITRAEAVKILQVASEK